MPYRPVRRRGHHYRAPTEQSEEILARAEGMSPVFDPDWPDLGSTITAAEYRLVRDELLSPNEFGWVGWPGTMPEAFWRYEPGIPDELRGPVADPIRLLLVAYDNGTDWRPGSPARTKAEAAQATYRALEDGRERWALEHYPERWPGVHETKGEHAMRAMAARRERGHLINGSTP